MRQEEQPSRSSRLIDEFCAFLFTTLRFPNTVIPCEGHMPPPARERLPPLSPARLASLMLGISLALTLSGSIAFIIGCMMMPWVLGMMVLLYFIGLLSSISMLWKVVLGLTSSSSPSKSSQKGISAAMAGTVIIFDFDKTIIDCDSDNWVIDELGATQIFDALLPTMPWNALMDRMMMELHAQGKTIDDIAEVLRRAPLDRHVASAIRHAYALGCDLRVVSDANFFFIETILKHHGLIGCFTEINTNPSYIDDEGRLRISPYHDFTISSHGCPLCPPNMCKSKIVERIIAEGKKKKIIYLGDGKGDYCPSLRLSEGDFVMPRKNYPVWELIQSDPSLLKAEVHEWSNGEELERVLLHLIRLSEFAVGNGTVAAPLLLSVDCKMNSMPANSHEPFPKVLPVPL